MQFKNPEILYFLFLLVLPILVHLFQLRRFKKEYFTNVKFLKELAIQTRKSSKIKKWLLLFTRLLLLTCLIIAFAQPFFKAKDSKNITNEMYIILDNSFSMQAKGNKGELLKRNVQELLENTPENQTFSLLTNTETFYNTDIKSLQKELQNIKYSATSFQLDNLLARIKARKSPYQKDVIVLTDAINLQPNQLKSIDSTLNPYFIVSKAEQKNNVSIDSVYIHQTLDSFYEIGIKISSFGKNETEIPVALYNQKKLIAKTQTKFDTKEKNIFFTIPKETFHGHVSIDDNSLSYDNDYYFSISKPEKFNVISIGDVTKSEFLSKIYTVSEFNYTNSELKQLNYNLLEKQDAIVLNELNEIPQALQTTLKSFLDKGGNVILIPSLENEISNLNSFLSSLGSIQFIGKNENEKLVTKISFSNPLYSGVFEKKIDNFQYPNTKNSFRLKSTYPSILSFEDGQAFLTSISKPLGSIYVFASPINKNNSNFQNSPLIVPTFYNMAQNVSKSGISALTIGNNKPFVVDALLSNDEIVSIENENEKFIPVQQILNQKVKISCVDFPESAGNFGVLKKEINIKNISFNYPRTESDLSLYNESLLSDYKVESSIENLFDSIQTDRTDNQLWKWLVILALLFLVIEVLIQKFVK